MSQSNRKYPKMEIAQNKCKEEKRIYQASSFWEKASQDIIQDIETDSIENFRNLTTCLGYFVPTYGVPGNCFSLEEKNKFTSFIKEGGVEKQILAVDQFFSGYSHALSDFRVFMGSDNVNKKPYLHTFSESGYGNPQEQFDFEGKMYSRSSLNYILGLCLLKKHLGNDEVKVVMEVGGGFGTLGEILKFTEGVKYIDVDIPPVSFIAHNYLQNIYGAENINNYDCHEQKLAVEDLKQCSVFNSWDIEKIEGKIDLFVNFISFQEMEPDIVENYLHYVNRLKPNWILLRNMREGKRKKQQKDEVGVVTPIKKSAYIAMLKKNYCVVEANVFPFGYKTVDGFHSELILFKRKKHG